MSLKAGARLPHPAPLLLFPSSARTETDSGGYQGGVSALKTYGINAIHTHSARHHQASADVSHTYKHRDRESERERQIHGELRRKQHCFTRPFCTRRAKVFPLSFFSAWCPGCSCLTAPALQAGAFSNVLFLYESLSTACNSGVCVCVCVPWCVAYFSGFLIE